MQKNREKSYILEIRPPGQQCNEIFKSLKGKVCQKRVLYSMKVLSQHIQESRYFHEIRMILQDRLENVLRWMKRKPQPKQCNIQLKQDFSKYFLGDEVTRTPTYC